MRYVAELLSSESRIHGALNAEAGRPAGTVWWAVVDVEARPRREVAYALRADALILATALNGALQSSGHLVG